MTTCRKLLAWRLVAPCKCRGHYILSSTLVLLARVSDWVGEHGSFTRKWVGKATMETRCVIEENRRFQEKWINFFYLVWPDLIIRSDIQHFSKYWYRCQIADKIIKEILWLWFSRLSLSVVTALSRSMSHPQYYLNGHMLWEISCQHWIIWNCKVTKGIK